MSVISYLWVLSVFILIAKKDSQYVQFHARQGFLLFLLSLVVYILGPIGIIVNVGIVFLSVWLILKAWAGQRWEIPYVGRWAQKISL